MPRAGRAPQGALLAASVGVFARGHLDYSAPLHADRAPHGVQRACGGLLQQPAICQFRPAAHNI
eukprot:9189332-Pyramimonas_sp.AAC.1